VPASTFATILLAVTLPDEELIELKRVENFLPHEEAEAQRAFRAPQRRRLLEEVRDVDLGL
jgi:hypothetical protein